MEASLHQVVYLDLTSNVNSLIRRTGSLNSTLFVHHAPYVTWQLDVFVNRAFRLDADSVPDGFAYEAVGGTVSIGVNASRRLRKSEVIDRRCFVIRNQILLLLEFL